ncbi:hypothetical protein NVP1171O_82 [Vibrio phage 1.171.O._10N.261.52.F12]|nr:hypothetical protein NVP1171O_82 [Vibrio phage 1.171.O._10N.261.52.F12]
MIHTFSEGVTENCVLLDPSGNIEVDVPYALQPNVIVIGYGMVDNIKRLEQLPDFTPQSIFKTFFKPHTCTETKPVTKFVMYETYVGICRLGAVKPLSRNRIDMRGRFAYKEVGDA